MTQDLMVCPYCKADPFSYTHTAFGTFVLAITCCEKAIVEAYQGLTGVIAVPNNTPLLPPPDPEE